jgi:hypothetical protein
MSFRFARPSRCAVFALTLATLLTASLFAQQPKVLAPHRPIAPRLPDNPPKSGPLRSMVGGLWMIDANFKSTIYIKNSVEIAPVTVTPILYLSNGKKITLADVTLEPSGTSAVSVNDGLNANGISPWATLNGYVEIQYKWPWDPICVTVTSVDTIHSVIFTTGLRPLEPMNPTAKALLAKGPGTQTVEGMWWKQEAQVTGFVALSNTTGQPIDAQLQVSDNAGHSIGEHAVTIAPHGTETVNLEELQSAATTAGGLRITYHGGMNDLLANGGLQDQASGYSASVPFVRSHSFESHDVAESYAELGLMSGAADPMMQFPAGTTFTPYSLLRNIGGQAATVTPSLYWMEGGTAHSARLQALTLAPYQTQSLNIPALLSLAGLQNFNGSFNLIFDVKGSVLMASGSVDQKNTYVFEVMPEAVKESASKSLGRWSIGNGDDTMVTLWNPADEAQDFVFTLQFSGGRYHLPIHLEARATEMFNVSEVARNQFPNLISSGVTEGSAIISGVHAENEHILVAVDAGVFNVKKATCSYSCRNCNGLVGSILVADGFGVTVGGNFQMSLKDTWNTGAQHDLTNLSTWTSSHTNLATVTSSGSARGLVTGVSAGSLLVTGTNDTEPWAGQLCGTPPQNCPPDTGTEGSGGGTVEDTPSGEITAHQGTYQNTAGQFLMTLEPGTASYDNHSVTESSPVLGTNTCWWSGSGMVQYPVVQGSTWEVDQGDAGHNQYGLDTVGFGDGVVVSLIQQQGPAHGVEFPCNVYIYQSMNYDGIDTYVTNLLSQTIGSITVNVCRAGVCSGTIPF